MKPYSGNGKTIFDRIDKLFFPISLNLNEVHVAVIDIYKRELVLYITSSFNEYPDNPVNNPVL